MLTRAAQFLILNGSRCFFDAGTSSDCGNDSLVLQDTHSQGTISLERLTTSSTLSLTAYLHSFMSTMIIPSTNTTPSFPGYIPQRCANTPSQSAGSS